jgi:hypothetical protein
LRHLIFLALTTLLLSLAGCGSFRYYPLPVSAVEARATFAPIATAASQLGYKQWRWDDQVAFEPSSLLRVTYMFDASGDYVMCVTVKDKNVSGGLDRAFAEGKRKGDEVWARAMALRPAPAVVIVPVVQPEPAVQINIH